MKKVSIIIPTFSAHEPWFLKAVASCSFADEIIITRMEGLTAAINEAVTKVRNDYFAILPDDDYFLPEVEKALETLTNIDGVLHFPCRHQVEDGEISDELFDVSPDIDVAMKSGRNQVVGSAFMRKDLFLELGGYFGEVCMDAYIWHKAYEKGEVFNYYPEPCVVFRWNKHSALQRKTGRWN